VKQREIFPTEPGADRRREIFPTAPGAARRRDFDFSERDDIEMSFIRTLSVHGLILSGAISAEDRRERIRLAIFTQRLEAAPFDGTRNFAQAYEFCYDRPLDMRRAHRAVAPSLAEVDVPEEEEEAGDFDDDESMGVSGYAA
jgi:hypothetical protein